MESKSAERPRRCLTAPLWLAIAITAVSGLWAGRAVPPGYRTQERVLDAFLRAIQGPMHTGSDLGYLLTALLLAPAVITVTSPARGIRILGWGMAALWWLLGLLTLID